MPIEQGYTTKRRFASYTGVIYMLMVLQLCRIFENDIDTLRAL